MSQEIGSLDGRKAKETTSHPAPFFGEWIYYEWFFGVSCNRQNNFHNYNNPRYHSTLSSIFLWATALKRGKITLTWHDIGNNRRFPLHFLFVQNSTIGVVFFLKILRNKGWQEIKNCSCWGKPDLKMERWWLRHEESIMQFQRWEIPTIMRNHNDERLVSHNISESATCNIIQCN